MADEFEELRMQDNCNWMQQNQNNFTRGSQIFAHQMRMLGQGSINALMIGLVSVVVVDVSYISELSLISLYYFIIERYVQLNLL
ncbi:putative conjugative transfer protein TraD [Rickettsia hoogstraalii str. RCCE3]|nr:putative conjugative transfer protein TraD [Rickettsia hoogstraalii str. RCCE3]